MSFAPQIVLDVVEPKVLRFPTYYQTVSSLAVIYSILLHKLVTTATLLNLKIKGSKIYFFFISTQ